MWFQMLTRSILPFLEVYHSADLDCSVVFYKASNAHILHFCCCQDGSDGLKPGVTTISTDVPSLKETQASVCKNSSSPGAVPFTASEDLEFGACAWMRAPLQRQHGISHQFSDAKACGSLARGSRCQGLEKVCGSKRHLSRAPVLLRSLVIDCEMTEV